MTNKDEVNINQLIVIRFTLAKPCKRLDTDGVGCSNTNSEAWKPYAYPISVISAVIYMAFL